MGTILNLETATTNCSVSVSVNGDLVSLVENNAANYSHAEQLHQFIEEALKEASFSFSDIDAVAVSKGPGSYTGLRIGVSAAKGLCFSLEVPLISVSTLQSMACQVQTAVDHRIISVLDARRMEVYAGVFNGRYEAHEPVKAVVLEADSFASYQEIEKVVFVGNGAEKCSQVLTNASFEYLPELMPSAREMAMLAQRKFEAKDFEDLAYFEPFYLKDFVLQQKQKK
ncbi:tRNA (adenosine(37)-N6)-threonylcarbamoyltransferase complex dimerization subunit type 1 TsaB [Flagellimonas sp. DF-77]|uniref:tRNA (adenosine(37)-N6)-threonylcarbamoyltransferase complex dimerization subunit type 1 TsaB n=1 Tax=Flagellimonas algarum TaxID=3230298 RepID=UPI0033924DE1